VLEGAVPGADPVCVLKFANEGALRMLNVRAVAIRIAGRPV